MWISNRVYNAVLDLYNANQVERVRANSIVPIRTKSKSINYNNINRRPRGYKDTN
jgi:hypothetical protein